MTPVKPRLLNSQYALPIGFKSGGMADVYKATDLQNNNQQVAVKLFRQGLFEAEIVTETVLREINALKELKHPNIVQLLDHGIDEETNRNFIVMEWIDYDLEEWLGNNLLGGWDDFYEKIGQPILKALELAHARHLIHRDLKPKNILMADGSLKLADFGISKLIKFSDSQVTLADFRTIPYTPKEFDDSSATFSRDVYSFGAIALRCLTNIELNSYEDIARAQDELDVPDEIYGIIERCLHDDPQRRPKDALLLSYELEKIWRKRVESWIENVACYLQLTQAAIRSFPKLNLSEQEIKRVIQEDLGNAFAIENYSHHSSKPNSNHYHLIGAEYRYQIALDDRDKEYFVILKVWSDAPSNLERMREKAWQPPSYFFKVGKPNPAQRIDNQNTIAELQKGVSEFQAERQRRELEEQEEQLFRIWGRILSAKNAFEKEKHKPLKYDRFSPVGNGRIKFNIYGISEEDLVGQPRLVRGDNLCLFGEIENVENSTLTFRITSTSGSSERIARRGQLEFDNRAAQMALDKQRKVLDSVRFCQSVRSDLKNIINHPIQARLLHNTQAVNFTQELDASKREAVTTALNAEDFLIVEGPPGTGKTTFITELILQELRKNRNARILLTSQTHVALDNAVERLAKLCPELKMVRLAGQYSAEKVATSVQANLLSSQMENWRKEALASGIKYLAGWAENNGISKHNVEVGKTIEELVLVRTEIGVFEKDQEMWAQERNSLKEEKQTTSQEALDQLSEDLDQLKDELKEKRNRRKELELHLTKLEDIGADLSKLSTSDLREWVKEYLPKTPENQKYLELQSIYTDWQKRFGRSPAFNAALLTSCQVVAGTCLGIMSIKGIEELDYDLCIVDESSKATPTETLIPLSRSRRWILVGDQRQLSPFQDAGFRDSKALEKYDLAKEDLKSTLFDHLVDNLPAECRSSLNIQHRMVAPIGNLISHCFYDGSLESAEKEIDNTLSLIFKRPVTWFTTAHLPNNLESRSVSSFVNHCEVGVVKKLLGQINWLAKSANKKYGVALLVGYTGQKREMERALNAERKSWEQLELSIETVDAFQGREADIALYSVTRSNKEGKIGFLYEQERINVALSRGRYYLGIIGDHHFCYTIEGDNPFRKVVEYIEQHTQECAINKEYK